MSLCKEQVGRTKWSKRFPRKWFKNQWNRWIRRQWQVRGDQAETRSKYKYWAD